MKLFIARVIVFLFKAAAASLVACLIGAFAFLAYQGSEVGIIVLGTAAVIGFWWLIVNVVGWAHSTTQTCQSCGNTGPKVVNGECKPSCNFN